MKGRGIVQGVNILAVCVNSVVDTYLTDLSFLFKTLTWMMTRPASQKKGCSCISIHIVQQIAYLLAFILRSGTTFFKLAKCFTFSMWYFDYTENHLNNVSTTGGLMRLLGDFWRIRKPSILFRMFTISYVLSCPSEFCIYRSNFQDVTQVEPIPF